MERTCKISECACQHEYQDKKYGKGNRLFNKTNSSWRCTACGELKRTE